MSLCDTDLPLSKSSRSYSTLARLPWGAKKIPISENVAREIARPTSRRPPLCVGWPIFDEFAKAPQADNRFAARGKFPIPFGGTLRGTPGRLCYTAGSNRPRAPSPAGPRCVCRVSSSPSAPPHRAPHTTLRAFSLAPRTCLSLFPLVPADPHGRPPREPLVNLLAPCPLPTATPRPTLFAFSFFHLARCPFCSHGTASETNSLPLQPLPRAQGRLRAIFTYQYSSALARAGNTIRRINMTACA